MESNFLPVEERNLEIPWNAYVHAQLQAVIRQVLEPFEGIPENTVGRLIRWSERLICHRRDGKSVETGDTRVSCLDPSRIPGFRAK
jgi:hypothetical protein